MENLRSFIEDKILYYDTIAHGKGSNKGIETSDPGIPWFAKIQRDALASILEEFDKQN